MPLRTTNTKDTRRFTDDDAWIDLRVGGLSKSEADRVRDASGSLLLDPAALAGDPAALENIEIAQKVERANQVLFDILCVDWSMDGDPTAHAYSQLDVESGRWVDECINEVLAERATRAEGKPRSSSKPRRRGTSSAKAGASS